MAERAKVQYGLTTIPLEVRRSRLRKQVSLVVEAGRKGVLVLAPTGTPVARLIALVRSRAAWAVKKLREVEKADAPVHAREFVSGESFTYLGRSFRLRVLEGPEDLPARLQAGWLAVTVERGRAPAARRRAVRLAVVAWYRARASARLPGRLERFTRKLGMATPPVLLRDQARRWGSCNEKGEVRLNWRVVQAPMALVDYVVAHEAVHLLHTNHTLAYWHELRRVLPDADEQRRELRRRGAGYLW